jgi:dihydropyrimidine dehydrogenase (NAD+) subunit PreA
MPDLSVDFCGIKSPNPFWLASAPPTNTGEQVMRAFDCGWGGAVFKTLADPPITNVSSRFASIGYGGKRMAGFNNIELISDRPLELNLAEIAEVKRRYPGHVLIASLMFDTKAQWQDIMRRVQDTGADGVELNFGCPHGMCERGMGSAVGQEPELLAEITSWVTDVASIPVIVKLTPNVGDIVEPALAAIRGKAHALSLINTIKSIMSVDLNTFVPRPVVGDASTNGGYCGPAVKPIALHMVGQLARHRDIRVPISGIGGISTWQDAAEFLALGSTTVQVCTEVMHRGFRVVDGLISGLSDYLKQKNMTSVTELIGKAVPNYHDWGTLDLNHHVVAKIDESKCIGCQLCYVACLDGSHQCIYLPGMTTQSARAKGHEHPPIKLEQVAPLALKSSRTPWVHEEECVGCNLCALVCPVPDCITMVEQRKAPHRQTWNERVAASY